MMTYMNADTPVRPACTFSPCTRPQNAPVRTPYPYIPESQFASALRLWQSLRVYIIGSVAILSLFIQYKSYI